MDFDHSWKTYTKSKIWIKEQLKKKPCTLQIFYMVSWTMDENKKVNSLIIQI